MEHPYLAHLPPPHGSTLVLEDTYLEGLGVGEAVGQWVEIEVGLERRGCGRLLRLALGGGRPLTAAAAGLLCARLSFRGPSLSLAACAACGLDLLLALCMYGLLLGLLAVLASSTDRARLDRHGRADVRALSGEG